MSRDRASDYQGASVLVTGGGGFIGSHVIDMLVDAGAEVTALDDLRDGTWDNLVAVRGRVRVVPADVRDAEAVEELVRECRPRIVFHLAANASVPRSVTDPAYDFTTNALGTIAVLEAIRKIGGCERLVLASSGAVYGQPVRFPITETAPLDPISPYGASKVSAEMVSRTYARVYGLPVVVARLFNAYGPRMGRFVVLDFLRKLRVNADHLEILGNGQQVRDFTYVSDTVQGLGVLGQNGEAGAAYNVSSGVSCTVTELARTLLDVLGFANRTRITYTGRSWKGDAQRWEVSIEKLTALGYRPRVSLREGLELANTWFQAAQGGREAS